METAIQRPHRVKTSPEPLFLERLMVIDTPMDMSTKAQI